MVDYASYIRNRITELRIQKDVSEYRMNLDLGQNRNYIQGITSGKALPSMAQFLNICEYFGITPMQFFDQGALHSQRHSNALTSTEALESHDMQLMQRLFERLQGNWPGTFFPTQKECRGKVQQFPLIDNLQHSML